MYREETPARWIYGCGEGVLKSYRALRSGRRSVVGFLFADDLFGLAENGNYVNTVQAVTSVTLYRIPVDTLTDILRQDAELQFQFLCKVTHELRDSQRRAIAIARRDAVGRLAMFVRMLESDMASASIRDTVSLPMTRADIANYLGLTPEAVSRASRRLVQKGICNFPTVTPCGLPTAPDSTSSPRSSERPATPSGPVLDYGQYASNEPRRTDRRRVDDPFGHGLTNLLTVMNASLDWITAGATPAQVQTEYGVLRRALDSASALAREMTESSSARVVERQSVDVNLLIAEIAHMLRRYSARKPVWRSGSGLPTQRSSPGLSISSGFS